MPELPLPKLYKPKNPDMPDVTWLVFNMSDKDLKGALEEIQRRYGDGGVERLKEYNEKGIMSLFNTKPTAFTIDAANAIAKRVDQRIKPRRK